MKQTIEEAAREYASSEIGSGGLKGVCGIEADKYDSFFAGAKWRESQIPEHISTVQDCEMAVRETKEKAIDALSKVLESWVHGGDADCIIAEFEELINKWESVKWD